MRRTKIVATLGPATDSSGVLDRMVRAGMDVVRVNFSHGEAADHVRRVDAVRQAARAAGREVAVLADLQGPKIRTDRFAEGKVFLDEGARFVLDAAWPANAGNKERVGITYKNLPNDVVKGDNLLLDDGKIVLEVTEISGGEIICRVLVGG
ncbi:MAG: pyruvate kinase, partial [Gammaproteobacteria bacterium]|nr:pyruvate kinase [Gammaproteobacteria bacterium]